MCPRVLQSQDASNGDQIVFCGFASRHDRVLLNCRIGCIASQSVHEGIHSQLEHGGRTSLRTSERLQNNRYTDGKRKDFLYHSSRDNLQIHAKRRVSDCTVAGIGRYCTRALGLRNTILLEGSGLK